MRLVGVAALAVVAVGAALTLRRGGSAPSAEPVATQQSASNVTAPVTAPAPTLPAPKIPTPPPAASAPTTTARPTTKAEAAPAPAPTDMSPALSLQITTQQARRRAVDAGAAAAQLAAGDQHLTAGAQFVRKSQRDAAMREFTQATSAFAEVEGAARAAAAAKEAARESAAAIREQPKAAAVAQSAPAPPVQAPPTQPASNPSAEIAAVVAQYARAIESRDVGELKRLYPGMSASQAGSFDDFFKSVRSVRAAFSVSGLQVDGATADAKLNGTYDFVTSNGRNEHQPLTLQVSLRKDGSNWRFVSIK